MFEFVKRMYQNDRFSKKEVRALALIGMLTSEQADTIVNNE